MSLISFDSGIGHYPDEFCEHSKLFCLKSHINAMFTIVIFMIPNIKNPPPSLFFKR